MKRWATFWRRQRDDMSCDEVGALLQLYIDDQLNAEVAEKVHTHLDDCVRCGLEVEVYEQIKVSLASQPEAVPADTIDRLHQFAIDLANGEGASDADT